MNDLYIMHYGVGHDKGGHSGRYPWGSGKNPKQDLKKLKKGMRKSQIQAERKMTKIMGKHPSLWREHYGHVLNDAGIYTVIGASFQRNRPKVKAAIEQRLKTDPKFRSAVEEAKNSWKNAGKDALTNSKSYIDHYKSSGLATESQLGAAKRMGENFARKMNKYSGMSDSEFATYYMYDMHRKENKARTIMAGALAAFAIYEGWSIYENEFKR